MTVKIRKDITGETNSVNSRNRYVFCLLFAGQMDLSDKNQIFPSNFYISVSLVWTPNEDVVKNGELSREVPWGLQCKSNITPKRIYD